MRKKVENDKESIPSILEKLKTLDSPEKKVSKTLPSFPTSQIESKKIRKNKSPIKRSLYKTNDSLRKPIKKEESPQFSSLKTIKISNNSKRSRNSEVGEELTEMQDSNMKHVKIEEEKEKEKSQTEKFLTNPTPLKINIPNIHQPTEMDQQSTMFFNNFNTPNLSMQAPYSAMNSFYHPFYNPNVMTPCFPFYNFYNDYQTPLFNGFNFKNLPNPNLKSQSMNNVHLPQTPEDLRNMSNLLSSLSLSDTDKYLLEGKRILSDLNLTTNSLSSLHDRLSYIIPSNSISNSSQSHSKFLLANNSNSVLNSSNSSFKRRKKQCRTYFEKDEMLEIRKDGEKQQETMRNLVPDSPGLIFDLYSNAIKKTDLIKEMKIEDPSAKFRSFN